MNPNGLSDQQVKQGYSTVPGNFDPVTGQLKTTITSASLAPQPSPDLSQSFTPQKDLVTPTVAGAGANQSAFDTDYQRYLDLQNQGQDNSLANMIAGIDLQSLTGRGGAQAEAEGRLGVNQFNQAIADLSSQRGSKLAAYNQSIAQQRAEQAQLEAGAGAKGLTTAMLGGQQAALARVREAENQTAAAEIGLLDAQILGTQGKLEAAQNAANRAVDLMYQDREAQVNTKLKQIELYTPIFNAQEKKKADALTFALNKENERLQTEKENAKLIQNYLIVAGQQEAPRELVDRARKAKTPEEAVMILGRYAGDVLDRQLKLSQIANSQAAYKETKMKMEKLQQEINNSKGTLSLDRSAYPYGSKEYVTATILNSAGYDKGLDQDQRNSITAATRALNSVDVLTGVLNGTKKLTNDEAKSIFGDGSGVIQGRLRTLAAGLGGDADAAAINAIITGLIPTVARGIFGEVGVLTDQDIANYRQTVPNLNSPENVNTLVSLVLADTAQKMIGGTLTTAANNRQNVSGFRDDYLNSIAKSESIRSNLGQLSSETTSKLDDVAKEVGVGGQTVGVPNNSASGLLNQYMGIKPIQFNKN